MPANLPEVRGVMKHPRSVELGAFARQLRQQRLTRWPSVACYTFTFEPAAVARLHWRGSNDGKVFAPDLGASVANGVPLRVRVTSSP